MRSSIAALFSLAALSSALPAKPHSHFLRSVGRDFGCGAEPSAEFLEISKNFGTRQQKLAFKSHAASIEVETYIHIVAAAQNSTDNVSDQVIADQVDVLNKEYGPYGISFNLAGTTRTFNSDWSNDHAELDMKKALRQGPYSALNLYFMTDPSGYLGYCYFPTNVAAGSDDFYLDGCSILYSSMPGGATANYDLGKTATHEIGHWFGLLHTFQGGSCTGAGDEIGDTPQQLSPTSGCPVGRDSCPTAEGLDPIHNYMDYSYDACYEEFTPLQVDRAYNMYNTFRAPSNATVKRTTYRSPL